MNSWKKLLFFRILTNKMNYLKRGCSFSDITSISCRVIFNSFFMVPTIRFFVPMLGWIQFEFTDLCLLPPTKIPPNWKNYVINFAWNVHLTWRPPQLTRGQRTNWKKPFTCILELYVFVSLIFHLPTSVSWRGITPDFRIGSHFVNERQFSYVYVRLEWQ